GRVPARSDGASAAVAPAAGGGPPVPVAARSGGAPGRRLRAPAVAGVATGAQERRRARRASVAHRGGPYRGIRDTGNGLGGIRGATGGAGGDRVGGGRGGGSTGRRGGAVAAEDRAQRGAELLPVRLGGDPGDGRGGPAGPDHPAELAVDRVRRGPG